MRIKIKTLLIFMIVSIVVCGCSTSDNNTEIDAEQEYIDSSLEKAKLYFKGNDTGLQMVYADDIEDCYIGIRTIGLLTKDGKFKEMVETLGGKYEYISYKDSAEWQIGLNNWSVREVKEEQRGEGYKILRYEAFRNDNSLTICDGQTDSFSLSIKDLESLLQVEAEINYEDCIIDLVPVYTN